MSDTKKGQVLNNITLYVRDVVDEYYAETGDVDFYKEVVASAERGMVSWALHTFETKVLAADKLSISRATLNKKLDED